MQSPTSQEEHKDEEETSCFTVITALTNTCSARMNNQSCEWTARATQNERMASSPTATSIDDVIDEVKLAFPALAEPETPEIIRTLTVDVLQMKKRKFM